MKNERLQHTIDLLKQCGEAKGMTLTDEEMAGKIGVSVQQLQAYLEGEESAPAGLRARLKAAYNDLTTAIRQDGYRASLQSSIRATKAFGREVGLTITEEDMALKLGMPFAQLQAYVNGEQPTPRNMTGLMITAYEDLRKEIDQRSLNRALRSTMDTIQKAGARQGKEITAEEMARQLGLSAEELAACLQDRTKTHEEFSALSDRLWAANAELLKNIRTVSLSSTHTVKRPLHIELDIDDSWDSDQY